MNYTISNLEWNEIQSASRDICEILNKYLKDKYVYRVEIFIHYIRFLFF